MYIELNINIYITINIVCLYDYTINISYKFILIYFFKLN